MSTSLELEYVANLLDAKKRIYKNYKVSNVAFVDMCVETGIIISARLHRGNARLDHFKTARGADGMHEEVAALWEADREKLEKLVSLLKEKVLVVWKEENALGR